LNLATAVTSLRYKYLLALICLIAINYLTR